VTPSSAARNVVHHEWREGFIPPAARPSLPDCTTEEVTQNAVSPSIRLGAMAFETIERVASLLAARLHDVEDIRVGRSWTGIYPMTSDHKPIVGHHSENPSVVCALGAGGRHPAVASDRSNGRRHDPGTTLRPLAPAVDWSHDRFSGASRTTEARITDACRTR